MVGLDFDLLAKDNIRILKIPDESFRSPLVVVLVGIPGSGKSYFAKKLSQKLPFVVLAEREMTSFLAPRATVLRRGAIEVFELAIRSIEQLVKMGKSCVYDANLKTRVQRELIREIVEGLGGRFLIVQLSCAIEICYRRVKKKNLAIMRGEEKGFILNRDYFEYEVSTTEPVLKGENALVVDTSKSDNLNGALKQIAEKLYTGT